VPSEIAELLVLDSPGGGQVSNHRNRKSITLTRQNCVHKAEIGLTYPPDLQIRS